jgi:RHS repeat-associated protein
VSYTYDAEGNVTVLTYPDGKTVTYTYDGANRMKTVTDWAARVTTYNYDAAGRLVSLARPNGTIATYTYDNANRLTGTTETRGLDTFWQATYTFDAAYRLTGYNPVPMNKTWPPPPATMTYDVDNRLITYNGASVASDLDGNLLQAPLHGTLLGNLTWDARNRLTSAQSTIPNPKSPISYSYDAENRRTSSTNSTGTTTYAWSRGSLDRLLVKNNPDGSITRYIYGLGLLYEENEPDGGGSPTTRFYHYNWQGSTVAITDTTGTVTTRIGYNPYGHHTVEFGNPNTPFLFNGQWGVMTEPNGLLSMMARFYSPTFRRFLSEDPAGFAGGINLYAFAGGDPINFMDPFGLGPISVWERLAGGAQFVGGVSQSLLGLGVAIVGSPTVAGSVIGVLVTVHGLDQSVAGWNTMLGYPTDTVTTTLLMESGIPYHTAVTIDASLGMGGSMKVAAMTMQTAVKAVGTSYSEKQMITVIGSLEDTGKYVGQKGYNVLNVPDDIYKAMSTQEFDRLNADWLNAAIQRGDTIAAVTDPASHAARLESIRPGLSQNSRFLNLELPMLQEYGVLPTPLNSTP